ncbi:hypothetical protein GCM10023324_56230 [Streptomyces youssoufiensis]
MAVMESLCRGGGYVREPRRHRCEVPLLVVRRGWWVFVAARAVPSSAAVVVVKTKRSCPWMCCASRPESGVASMCCFGSFAVRKAARASELGSVSGLGYGRGAL